MVNKEKYDKMNVFLLPKNFVHADETIQKILSTHKKKLNNFLNLPSMDLFLV